MYHLTGVASVRLVRGISSEARGDCLGTLGMPDTGQALGTVMRIVIRGHVFTGHTGNRNILFPVDLPLGPICCGVASQVHERVPCLCSYLKFSHVSTELNESYNVICILHVVTVPVDTIYKGTGAYTDELAHLSMLSLGIKM